jgi:hypothetical protein
MVHAQPAEERETSKLIPLGNLKKLLFILSVTVVGFRSEDN